MDSIWMQILAFALPGGFLGSVFTWIFSRRKQNNDFLKELQSSINLLSGENKKILEENIQLRRENIDLKANQEEMLVRIDRLTKEVERLRKTIGKRNSYEDKTLFAALHPAAGNDDPAGGNADPAVQDVLYGTSAEHDSRLLPADDIDAIYDHDVPTKCPCIPD